MAPAIIERCSQQAQALDRESAKHLLRLTVSDMCAEAWLHLSRVVPPRVEGAHFAVPQQRKAR
jgi:hypothetical protein